MSPCDRADTPQGPSVTKDVADFLDMMPARKADKQAAKEAKTAGEGNVDKSAAKPKGAVKSKAKAKSKGKPNASDMPQPPPKAKSASKPKGKAKANVMSKKAESSSTPLPAAIAKAAPLILGCSKCRWSEHGCGQCRRVGFQGHRWNPTQAS